MNNKRLLIVGGVAGGASCAARARRLSETAEIIIFERGPFVSFANCGLPYYVGDVIKEEDDLLVATPEMFKAWFNIEVRTQSNVVEINPAKKTILVENRISGQITEEAYDTLVLAPGAAPIRPPIDGIDLPGIFVLRTIPDTLEIKRWLGHRKTGQVAVVGGGFIGLEMAENLHGRGFQVTIIEMQPQVMPAMDAEMAVFIHDHLRQKGVKLLLGRAAAGFSQNSDGTIAIDLSEGQPVNADMVLLAIGVKPEVALARAAGLEIGSSGGIVVDGYMQTSDKNIYAVGDAVETTDYAGGQKRLVPLAGPANRQGRLAADVIMGHPKLKPFRGVQATAVCGVLGLTIAATGLSEKQLKQAAAQGKPVAYDKVYLFPNDHAGYYPGAKTISLKLIFSLEDGRVLGAQAVGLAGVAKRIDVIATTIQYKGSVYDLAEAELCYAPQYGSAKDPINMAGMIASNALDGLSPLAHWETLDTRQHQVVDVRTPKEFQEGHVEGAINIPLHKLRDSLGSLPRAMDLRVYCTVGQRSYYATRILLQNGFKAKNLSGGYVMYMTHQQVTK